MKRGGEGKKKTETKAFATQKLLQEPRFHRFSANTAQEVRCVNELQRCLSLDAPNALTCFFSSQNIYLLLYLHLTC